MEKEKTPAKNVLVRTGDSEIVEEDKGSRKRIRGQVYS
jgi:hypothetical protein